MAQTNAVARVSLIHLCAHYLPSLAASATLLVPGPTPAAHSLASALPRPLPRQTGSQPIPSNSPHAFSLVSRSTASIQRTAKTQRVARSRRVQGSWCVATVFSSSPSLTSLCARAAPSRVLKALRCAVSVLFCCMLTLALSPALPFVLGVVKLRRLTSRVRL